MTICEVLWVGFWVLWLLWAIRIKKTQHREGIATHFAHAILAAVGFLLIFVPIPLPWLRARIVPTSPWVEAIGVGITLAGFALAMWARGHLGRNWSSAVTSRIDHELVCSGPYRWVRHPIYAGLLIALFGTALVQHVLSAFAGLPLVYLAWKIKSRGEEKMMVKTFGTRYTIYASRTGAMFPRLH